MAKREENKETDTLRKSKLKEYLRQQEYLARICKSQDYQLGLKPILQAAFHNKWLDPAQLDKEGKLLFQTLEQFHRAYNEAFQRAKAFEEIYNDIELAEQIILSVTKQINEPEKNFEL